MTSLRETLTEVPDAIFSDLLESPDAYLLVVDLPGATPESTTITPGDGKIHVEAARVQPAGDPIQMGRPATLELELPVPGDADVTAASATLVRGVLELTIPKVDTTTTQIPVEDA